MVRCKVHLTCFRKVKYMRCVIDTIQSPHTSVLSIVQGQLQTVPYSQMLKFFSSTETFALVGIFQQVCTYT
jgi:hypothetical protein